MEWIDCNIERLLGEHVMNPLFSIITPVYNNRAIIEMAIASVEEQDFEDYEYIIVDDGSNDGTSAIVDEYANIDNRVRVIHQNNKWIYASFNVGIKHARGEYIFILNSDDRLKKGVLKKTASILQKYTPDIVLGKYEIIKPFKNNVEQVKIVWLDYGVDLYLATKSDFQGKWIDLYRERRLFSQTHFYKRDVIKGIEFEEDTYLADRYFNIDIADRIKSAYIINEPIYEYYVHGDGSNASLKYYSYAHDGLNKVFIKSKQLLNKWNLDTKPNLTILSQVRLYDLTIELKRLIYGTNKLNIDDKISKILSDTNDLIMHECIELIDDKEQLEARVLNALRDLFMNERINNESMYYFIYLMLESLLRYEKTEEDYNNIRDGVYNKLNPNNIGKSFWEKLN